jgi:hypothetical protein
LALLLSNNCTALAAAWSAVQAGEVDQNWLPRTSTPMDPMVQNQITNENSPKQKDALRTSISMKLPDFEGETRHTSFLKAVCRLLREP